MSKITKSKVGGFPVIMLIGAGAIGLVAFHLYGKTRERQAARARAFRRAYGASIVKRPF